MTDDFIDDAVVTNILASLITCFLIGIERELPPHAKKGRLIRKVEEAIVALAQSNPIQLNESQNAIGTKLYNKIIKEFEILITEELENERRIVLGELQTGSSSIDCGSNSSA